MYDKLFAMVNSLDTSGFVLKAKYDTDKSELEKKIPDTSWLVRKTDSAKISEIERNNHDKYITTPAFNKFTAEIFTARLTQANLVTKTDFDTNLIRPNKKIKANKAKPLLV